jgi:hypothetical protein
LNSETKTEDPLEATLVSFQNSPDKIKLTDPSGYKDYDCWTILFFYSNCEKDHPSYLQILVKLDTQKSRAVQFMDRKDLLVS